MRKKVSYILMISLLFLLVGSVKADYTCKYYKVNAVWNTSDPLFYEEDVTLNEEKYISFVVKDGNVSRSDVSSSFDGGKEEIVNWNSEYGGFSAQKYSSYNLCPRYVITLAYKNGIGGNEWAYFVSDSPEYFDDIQNQYKKKYNGKSYTLNNDCRNVLRLVSGPEAEYDFDKEFTVTYNSNYPSETNKENGTTTRSYSYETLLGAGARFLSMASSKVPSGYIFTGWKVCGTDSNNYTTCFTDLRDDEDNVKEIYAVFGYEQKIEIKAQWKVATETISPLEINEYGLGETQCKNSGYVWNEKEYNGEIYSYCNVDNLLYVGCGGANDIPVEVPALISLFVNLLKIATPIILIFVSIITLLKAMSAQKEDEIKKATSSLVKKIIAAAMVFFVIAIVQYIVSIVASDEEDYGNFTNCLDCFLNNSCETSTYYRTVSNGIDYCTPLTTGDTDTCENVFK